MPLLAMRELSHRERTETIRITSNNHAVLRQEHQRERTFQLQQSLSKRLCQRTLTRPRHQVQHDFGVARCLEDGALRFQFAPKLLSVSYVPVVRDCDQT